MERLFVLASHGNFAGGLYSSVQMILGEQQNVHIINAYTETMQLREQIQEICAGNKDKEIIVVTDLYGGSVNNEFEKWKGENFHLVTGMNLPLVLALLSPGTEKMDTVTLIRESILMAQQSLKYCNEITTYNMPDEEF